VDHFFFGIWDKMSVSVSFVTFCGISELVLTRLMLASCSHI
jgi:hypothetical protein